MARLGQITAEVLVYEDPLSLVYTKHIETLIKEATEARIYTNHIEVLVKEGISFYALLVTMC